MIDRFKKLNILSLQDVEQELELLLSIVDLDRIDDDTFKYLSDLTKLAKSLGSVKKW